jgi:hypothetical protein
LKGRENRPQKKRNLTGKPGKTQGEERKDKAPYYRKGSRRGGKGSRREEKDPEGIASPRPGGARRGGVKPEETKPAEFKPDGGVKKILRGYFVG